MWIEVSTLVCLSWKKLFWYAACVSWVKKIIYILIFAKSIFRYVLLSWNLKFDVDYRNIGPWNGQFFDGIFAWSFSILLIALKIGKKKKREALSRGLEGHFIEGLVYHYPFLSCTFHADKKENAE